METEAYEGVTTWMLLRDPFWRIKPSVLVIQFWPEKERLSATRTSKAHLMKTRELSLIIPQFGTHGKSENRFNCIHFSFMATRASTGQKGGSHCRVRRVKSFP